jgi:hypothetical protein
VLHVRMKLAADLTEDWTGTTPPGGFTGWNTRATSASGTQSSLIDTDGVTTGVGYSQTEWWDYATDLGTPGTTGLHAEIAYTYQVHNNGSDPVTVAFFSVPAGTYTLRLHHTDANDNPTTRFTCNADARSWSTGAYQDWTGLSPSGGTISAQTGLSGSTAAASLCAIELIQTAEGGTETLRVAGTAALSLGASASLRVQQPAALGGTAGWSLAASATLSMSPTPPRPRRILVICS